MKSLTEKVNSYLAYLDGRRAQVQGKSIYFDNLYYGKPESEWFIAGFTDSFNERVNLKGGSYDAKTSNGNGKKEIPWL